MILFTWNTMTFEENPSMKYLKMNMPNSFNWNSTSISKFWNFYIANNNLENYFTYQVSDSIVQILNYLNIFNKNKSILDFGCGPGFFIESIINKNITIFAADSSEETIKSVDTKFSAHANYGGSFDASAFGSKLPKNYFDVVCCFEVIEHMTQSEALNLIINLCNSLKNNGILIITTPYDEDLKRSFIMCPSCNAIFHTMQHMRSINRSELINELQSQNLKIEFCEEIDLWQFKRKFPNMLDASIKNFSWNLIAFLCKAVDIVFKPNFPNQFEFKFKKRNGSNLMAIASIKKPA